MPDTLVDSNVLPDVLAEDRRWFEWSSSVCLLGSQKEAWYDDSD